MITDQGLCYTINPYIAKQPLTAESPGIREAFTVLIDPQTDEIQQEFGADTGIKVAIHDRSEYALMDYNSIKLLPGKYTYISLKKHINRKLGKPYS